MKVRDEIARHYWQLAAVQETRERYANEGYEVEVEALLGEHRADLVARRGDETVVVVFNTDRQDYDMARSTKQLRNYVVHQLDGRFLVTWAVPPREREIEVDGLEEALLGYITENMPNELEELSTHTDIEEVADLFVSSISVLKTKVTVSGKGAVAVNLVYGSDSDWDRGDGLRSAECYPLQFEAVLTSNLKIVTAKIEIDTSSFYE